MPRPGTIKSVRPAPADEEFIRLTLDALMGLMTALRTRVVQTGTRRDVTQILLAEAHIDEAAGILRTIQSTPNVREATFRGTTMLRPAGRVRKQLLRTGSWHDSRLVGI
jgi:hypothetical protein